MPRIPLLLFLLAVAVYLLALGIDTMDVDASQYARISSEMLQSGNYLQLYEGGKPYLDKPPFLFWISSVGMWLLGFNNAGYKIPSILFALLALYATYRFARLLYGAWTARAAAFIMATSQAMFLMTNDVRTDTVLMSWVIMALWMWKEWDVQGKTKWILGAFACMAFGMMSKGPIALIAPVATMGVDWLLKKKWKHIFTPWHLVGLLVMAVLLLPMSIGLYQQYDLHPELEVNGKTGVSGLRFFYWTQSFGRITGENVWNNGAPFSFLFENMLWAFLPWTLLFVAAYVLKWMDFFKAIKNKTLAQHEWHTLFGFTLVYIMLGLSKYQLPHYLFVVYPLAAVLTAQLIARIITEENRKRLLNGFTWVQFFIGLLMIIFGAVIVTYVFPQHAVAGSIISILFCALFLFLSVKKNKAWRLLVLSGITGIMANVIMTVFFYPSLLKYQAGSNVGRYIKAQLPSDEKVYLLDCGMVSMHFYAQRSFEDFHAHSDTLQHGYVMTKASGWALLKEKNYAVKRAAAFPNYGVSTLSAEFLNPATRAAQFDSVYVFSIRKEK